MQTTAASTTASVSRARLWAEFLGLFVGVPVLMTAQFDEIQRRGLLFPTILGLALIVPVRKSQERNQN